MAPRDENGFALQLFSTLRDQISRVDGKLDRIDERLNRMENMAEDVPTLQKEMDEIKAGVHRRTGIWLALSGVSGAIGGFGGKTVLTWLGFVKP